MALRSGTPLWQTLGLEPIEAPHLEGDLRAEVAIIGGGITGALIAHRLVREGVDVVLVDKRSLGTGSTAASTGLLQYEVDTPLATLIAKRGQERAVHAYARGVRAIDEIEQLVDQLGDPCGFSRRDSLYFASGEEDLAELREEFDCRRAFGFDVEWLEPAALADMTSIRAPGAIISRRDGQIDPYRFTQRLLAAAIHDGLRAFARTEIKHITEEPDHVELVAAEGRIRARRVVYATGYDSGRYLAEREGKLHSTYALASEPLASTSGWPDGVLVWETARPYFYARQSGHGRAIVGGEDTPYRDDHERDGLVERKIEKLVERFTRLFPEIELVPEFAWAGTFGESDDGLAYIGFPPDRPSALFAMGYGGNGITFSTIASKLIADLHLGRPNPDAEVFAFGR